MINFSLSQHLKTQYKTEYPFPHTVIDNFVNEQFLNRAVNDLQYVDWGSDAGEETDTNQVKKLFSPYMIGMWNNMPEHVTNLLNFLNSREVLKFLEELTGIPDLIADPEFYGGGVHRILPGLHYIILQRQDLKMKLLSLTWPYGKKYENKKTNCLSLRTSKYR